MENEYDTEFLWSQAPDSVIIHIFSFLNVYDFVNCSIVCKSWYQIGRDELLWKHLLCRDYHLNPNIPKSVDVSTWREDYKRLKYNVPQVMTECLESHGHQVLHVAFSHDGSMFSTTSKDGRVIVWNSSYPCKIKYKQDMTEFRWKYTQFSQFNGSDTLLLVSGVHFGSPHNTSGEIAVFTVQNEFLLQCRVTNKPYDVFGCWIGDHHLVSSELFWLAHQTSLTTLWLNKASQELESEHIPVISQLYRFYNPSASSVRSVMIADCKLPMILDDLEDVEDQTPCGLTTKASNSQFSPCTIVYDSDYRASECKTNSQVFDNENSESSSESDDLSTERLLIFTCGRETYIPHQIGFKHIVNLQFPKQLPPGPSIQERVAARVRERAAREIEDEVQLQDWADYEAVKYLFDEPSKVIDIRGHIVGMALSPDHRYLYVNSRDWPRECEITNALDPPTASSNISIHVIDLSTLRQVGKMDGIEPTFYQQSSNCFYLFLDVSDNLVASGTQDYAAYIWDRHYGILLLRLPHHDVVNAVAFNPADEQMCVTVSDDYSIKVWRSKSAVRKLGLNGRGQTEGSQVHTRRPCNLCDQPSPG